MILHLGVVEFPYEPPPGPIKSAAQVRRQRRNDARSAFGATEYHNTTGDVAQILEDKYHIMEIFIEEIGADQIAKAIEHSAAGALETMISSGHGRDAPVAPLTLEAQGEIEDAFRYFLSQQEMDGVVPGVPTLAALAGVSHRFKHPYAKRPSRPSFIDTGLFEYSFTVWTDD